MKQAIVNYGQMGKPFLTLTQQDTGDSDEDGRCWMTPASDPTILLFYFIFLAFLRKHCF